MLHDYTAAMLEESETPESAAVPAEAHESQPAGDLAVDNASGVAAAHLDAGDTPSVDELQGRLADLQGAMDQLQSGDLDGAEATIAALEESMGSTPAASQNPTT